ncbi:MAG TPA: hypothetical protein VMU18_07970 [Rhodoblastus sp.]|nr:hypothetical protein [Rhodoblastus sp.]
MAKTGGKNPFMSLWLSGANKVIGAARGHAMNEMRRQQGIALRKAQKAAMDFWSGALAPRSAKPRKKRK